MLKKVLIELQRCLAANRRPIAINVNGSFRDRTATIWNIGKEIPGAGLMSLSNEATISAWFNRQIDNQLLTAGEDGLVALWEIQGEALR